MIRLHPYDSSDGVLRSSILSLLSEAFGEEGQPYYELAMEYLYDGCLLYTSPSPRDRG